MGFAQLRYKEMQQEEMLLRIKWEQEKEYVTVLRV